MRAAFRRFWHSSNNRFLTKLLIGDVCLAVLFLVLGAPWWMALIPVGGTLLIAIYVLRAVSGRH